MKALIVTACICIISSTAVGGIWLYNDFRAYQVASRKAACEKAFAEGERGPEGKNATDLRLLIKEIEQCIEYVKHGF